MAQFARRCGWYSSEWSGTRCFREVVFMVHPFKFTTHGELEGRYWMKTTTICCKNESNLLIIHGILEASYIAIINPFHIHRISTKE